MIATSCFGHYEYGGQVFIEKNAVLAAAVQNNDPDPQVHFNFNDAVFGQLDWQLEPQLSLAELYRMRAQQLRDSYDYLILFYSGGSDSREVLHSFLDNGIFLDQVVTMYPTKLAAKLPVVWDPYHADAFLFEHELTTVPGLKDVHQRSPHTKTQVVDCSDELLNFHDKDNYWSDRAPLSRMGGVVWCTKINAGIQYAREQSEGRGKVAVIWGCDKPSVTLYQGVLYNYFVDTGLSGSQVFRPNNSVNFTPEMFFSSAAAPLIPVKQCHVIKHWLEQVPAFYRSFESWSNDPKSWAVSRELTKHMIYPSWNTQIFQGDKRGHFKFEDCRSFMDRVDPRIAQGQQSRRLAIHKKFSALKSLTSEHNYLINATGTKYRIGTVKSPVSK